jgi:hypothetical protein
MPELFRRFQIPPILYLLPPRSLSLANHYSSSASSFYSKYTPNKIPFPPIIQNLHMSILAVIETRITLD